MPLRVGVAGHVEPVPAPPLAVVRRRQQPVHDLGERVRASRREERSTSSGVGGRPVRSKVTRRSSVRLSAGGEGWSPSASSRASTNRSMSEIGQCLSFTDGVGGLPTGRNAQCSGSAELPADGRTITHRSARPAMSEQVLTRSLMGQSVGGG